MNQQATQIKILVFWRGKGLPYPHVGREQALPPPNTLKKYTPATQQRKKTHLARANAIYIQNSSQKVLTNMVREKVTFGKLD